MTTLKAQLEASGLHVSVTLRETGQQLVLNFKKGERRKKVHVVLGNYSLEGEIELLNLDGVEARLPNLVLSLTVPNKAGVATIVTPRDVIPETIKTPETTGMGKVRIPVETEVSVNVPLTVEPKVESTKPKFEMKKK
jgi:hypothetical protein